MGLAIRLSVSGALSLALTAGLAEAATKPIRGKLDKAGYTVIALATDGQARATRAGEARFSLRPTSSPVTLHLRAPSGVYAGPVVLDRVKRGKRAILGVKPGAKLGEIDVRRGYAKAAEQVPEKWVDANVRSRARKGVPRGARRFGRVLASIPRARVPGDLDFDGIPDALDIDDDGDLILDEADRRTGAAVAQAADERFDVNTGLSLAIEQTVNANAAAISMTDIDSALSGFGIMNLDILSPGLSELDCAADGLNYCSPGGTGIVQAAPPNPPAPFSRLPFPGCCDDDDVDPFGTMQDAPGDPPGGMALEHHATTAQIGTGDLLIQRIDGNPDAFPANLGFVFATVPALMIYRDGASPANTVTPAYPVGAGGPGTQGNEFLVDVGCQGVSIACTPATDVVVELTVWRPQRERLALDPPPGAGESAVWTDVGGLNYQTVVQHIGTLPGGTTVQQPCPQSTYGTADPNLTNPPGHLGPGLTDTTTDHPSSSSRTVTYTLNLTRCVTALGATWGPSDPASIFFGAQVTRLGESDGASQTVWFKRK